MKKGMKKAAIVMAAAVLLSACGGNKVATTDVSIDELVVIMRAAFGASVTAEEMTTYGGVACQSIRSSGDDGAQVIRDQIYDATGDIDYAHDAISGIVNVYCPDLAK
jgi:hypothetical protein